MTPIHHHSAPIATTTLPRLPGLRRAWLTVAPCALPMLALLAGSLLPESASVAAAIGPGALGCSILLGVVSLPALDAGVDSRGLPGTIAAVFAFALLSPALTMLACTLAVHAGLATDSDLQWATLAAAAPVSIGAVVTARSLGLGQRRMAGHMILSTLAMPFVVPQLAWAVGITGTAGVGTLAIKVAGTSMLPLLAGLAIRTIPAMARPHVRLAASRLSLAALMLLGLVRGLGLEAVVAQDVPAALQAAGMAAIVALCGAVASWLVMRRWPDAVLAGVFRSNTLVWASLVGTMDPRAALLMSVSTLATYGAPLLARLAIGRVGPPLRSSVR